MFLIYKMEFETDGFGSFGGLAYENIPINEADVLFIGIPYESATSGQKGASFAPSEFRLLSADLQTVSRAGIDLEQTVIADLGNIKIFPIEGHETRNSIENSYKYLFENSETSIITFGGDHSISYPILKALSSLGSVGIIWFDAHRDLLSELLGSRFSHGSPLGRAIELENIDPKNVLLVGTRYMHPEEQKIVESQHLNEIRMVDLENSNFDLTQFKEKIIEISSKVDFVYLSIDIDVLDPAFAPGTGTPVGGGMTTSQLLRLVSEIPCKLRAIDITEVSPIRDQSNITLKATMSLFTELLAKLKLQNKL
jgi:agmatinase